MPLIVTCSCGKSFQAKDEYAGKTAKCTACGQVLTITGPLIQQIPSHQQPVHDEEVISPEAAAIMLQRQMQQEADARFVKKMMLVGGGFAAVVIIAAVIYMSTRSEPPSNARTPETPPQSNEAPPPAVVTATPVQQPAAQPSTEFNKAMIGVTNKSVKWSGRVVSGLSEDGATIVFLKKETLASGSTTTYQAALKLKEPPATPIPSGTEIVFEGTLAAGMKQSNEFREKTAEGTQIFDAVYTLPLTNVSIVSLNTEAPATTTAATQQPPATEGPPADDVEKFVRFAIQSKDRHWRYNAKVFRPDDKRLDFEDVVRPNPAKGPKMMFDKTDPVDSMDDLENGPPPTPETDQIEARMLMDADLVGDGFYMEGSSKNALFYVFLAPCISISQELQSKYGDAKKIQKSDTCFLHFYGRMIVVVLADGRVHAVMRKVVEKKKN
ncbi:MAG TPA: hypothetical protein VEK08_02260 [Planctomycetota bacterium]|nr:hypothetical protein [Planctomycetota bacterium]